MAQVSATISFSADTSLPECKVRIAVREDFVKGDATDNYNYVVLEQGDQKVIVTQREIRKTLEAIFAIME